MPTLRLCQITRGCSYLQLLKRRARHPEELTLPTGPAMPHTTSLATMRRDFPLSVAPATTSK